MNCEQTRAALDMAFDACDAPGAAVRVHLSRCAACTTYQANLAALDLSIRQAPPLSHDAALVARIQASIAAQPVSSVPQWGYALAVATTVIALAGLGWVLDRMQLMPVIAWEALMPQEAVLPEWTYLKQEFQAIPAAIFRESDVMVQGAAAIWDSASGWSSSVFGSQGVLVWGAFFACLAGACALNSLEWISRRPHR